MKEPIAPIESAMITGVRSLRIFKPPLSCAWLVRPKSGSAFRWGDGHFPPAFFANFFSAFIADDLFDAPRFGFATAPSVSDFPFMD
jgi:hypothetical protein